MDPLPKLCAFVIVAYFLVSRTLSENTKPSNNDGACHSQWRCISGRCVRNSSTIVSPGGPRGSPAACRLTCGVYGPLWPHPTGTTVLADRTLILHPSSINFELSFVPQEGRDYMEEVKRIFLANLDKECGQPCTITSDVMLTVQISVRSFDVTLTLQTDEHYSLELTNEGNFLTALIRSETVFGARHALETLSQLTAPLQQEDHQRGLLILAGARIVDRPAYQHRGLLLDTARHYISLQAMRRTMDGMAASKLNVLHWHATDSQSFPLESARVPQLSRFGAYSPSEVYTMQEVRQLRAYARHRGIRLLLEMDAPAHAGAGWQWGPAAGLGELVVCWRHRPWRERCVQPPCGQLNPANPHVFRILGDLYKDIAELVHQDEMFHMGGDEVFFPCWNSTQQITDLMHSRGMSLQLADFLRLWAEYQGTALRLWDEAAGLVGKAGAPVVLWSSHLTNPAIIEPYLPKDRYIIQTWVVGEDPLPSQLAALGYRVILSTKDAWYLDHGFWGSTQYHSWRRAYDNLLPRYKSVLGGEACMWSEYVDELTLDGRVWPRAAAVAERLWSDPATGSGVAEARLARHRERLETRGLQPEAIQPEWCYQNEGQCAA